MRSREKDRTRALIGGAVWAAIALVIILLAGTVFDSTEPPPPNGDQLGQNPHETYAAYLDRVADTLAAAPVDEAAWALITFDPQLDPRRAAQVAEPAPRVSAVIAAPGLAAVIAEPTGTETRGDVFERELGGLVAPGGKLAGLVAHATGDELRQIAGNREVAAVEALPPDAAWGRFGVRPVEPEGRAPED